MALPKFYLIIDDASWLPRLLSVGLKLVQLRIKNKPLSHIQEQIMTAKHLCDEAGCQLVVNDYWQLAIQCGCNYVHLGQEDLLTADIKQLKQAGIKLGISTHSQAELAVALTHSPDYIALGPIYETTLKKMPWQPQGLGRLTQWKSQLQQSHLTKDTTKDIALVAIGGLTLERAQGAYAAGADSVSVVSDVLMHPHPEERLRQWLQLSA